MEIFVEGLEFKGPHGVYPEERAEGRRFRVDLRVRVDQTQSMATDDLNDTLDYRALAQCILHIGHGPSCALIEHLASRILDAIFLHHPQVTWATVTLRKAAHGVPGDPPWVGVTLGRHRLATPHHED